MEISGRNRIHGVVTSVECEGIMAKVVIEYEGGEITSIITSEAVRDLRLRPGTWVAALIKATDVMVIR